MTTTENNSNSNSKEANAPEVSAVEQKVAELKRMYRIIDCCRYQQSYYYCQLRINNGVPY